MSGRSAMGWERSVRKLPRKAVPFLMYPGRGKHCSSPSGAR